MTTNAQDGNMVADRLEKLQIASDSDVQPDPNPGTNVDSTTVISNGTHSDGDEGESAASHLHLSTSHVIIGSHTNGVNGIASRINSDTEAKVGIPNIEINGKPEEDFVNNDIIGPEEEDDEDNQLVLERSTTSTGEKKKKKKKSKSKRGLTAPSGFEEYYVDAPLTPAEHGEEKGIYHNSVPFRERIEIAIQRFFAKRNLNSERKDVFDKYMAYGGVDSGQKMFLGGLDVKTLSERTAPEIATLTAKHSVGEDKADDGESAFVVDFDGVVKAFL